MVSDVPLGAFLSGGVDSSAVVALMANLKKEPVTTATIGFAEGGLNELPFAREVAEQYGTCHHEKVVAPDCADIPEKLVAVFDEPFADSSAQPTYCVSKLAREQVAVALSGDGGDENFAGYRRYLFDVLENRLRGMFPSWVRRSLICGGAALYPKGDRLPQWMRAKDPVDKSLQGSGGRRLQLHDLVSGAPDLFTRGFMEQVGSLSPTAHFRAHYRKADALCPLSRIQYLDMKTYLVDDILTKVDRTSMANSLEVRVSVLDHGRR
ncbi:asparagine synthase C-terminal domain-containing protein [Desulfoluna spongiiphila]|uniref:asparagine synthase C-terminal domain-containing protein n=1 Tax=Desulfoluna spongiiphila TaxID=419481 RepID=UPI0012531829|nr:asparagine synthase C-terminal domain-containing protein [Desulfoluna spongiiphila]VVS93995.1 asparagine synthase [Desulfoluna spongiiphila]